MYASPDIVRVKESKDGKIVNWRDMRNSYSVLVGKNVGRKQIGRSVWKVNIKIDFKETESNNIDK